MQQLSKRLRLDDEEAVQPAPVARPDYVAPSVSERCDCSALERLDNLVFAMLLSFLNFQDVLRLARINRRFLHWRMDNWAGLARAKRAYAAARLDWAFINCDDGTVVILVVKRCYIDRAPINDYVT